MRIKIVQAGEPVLRTKARTLSAEEILSPAIQELIGHMRDTMRDAPGVGLAAPQIGVPLRIAVIEDREEYLRGIAGEVLAERERGPVPFFVLINPEITHYSSEKAEFFEGCLSVAGFSALVRRSLEVTVKYHDEHAEHHTIRVRGWFARILQHEIDHLNGYLYIDRMEPRTFSTLENIGRYWRDRPVTEVREALELDAP